MADIDLLPCPFCGGTEIHIGPMYPPGAWECWEVGCNNDDCPLEADSVKVALGTPEKAAAAWNTRATDANIAALQAEIERLNRILGRIVEGDGDSTLVIRMGADAFAAAREYLLREQEEGK